MNLKPEFNRLEHLFNNGIEKTRREAGHLVDSGVKRANEAARRARQEVDARAQTVVDYEQAVVRHMRDHSTLYLIGGALLIGVLVAKIVREIRQSRELETAPLL
jgi:hypothetical protein